MNAERTYYAEQVVIHFQENKEVAYQCQRLDDNYYLAVDVYILQEGEVLHRYFRHFEREVHVIHYHNFIKKFLRDPQYRKDYLANGELNWEGVLDLDAPKRKESRYA